ncbi:MAG TPA: efflux RND transporter periplasmic adaptor subunit, partial [Bryobacteraceae bacterium]|nr:efflux RND transporter periplasmic adaptor subunit [Bryobacteraceae bacterium]
MTTTNPHHISPWKVVLFCIAGALVVFAIGLAGYLPRHERETAAVEAAAEQRAGIPTVTVVKVVRAPENVELSLPGSISAVAEASIYARAAGYVAKRLVDIGDRVQAGQEMAELDTPDLDQQVAQLQAALAQAKQQLTQAQASLAQAEAQRDLAKVTFERYDNLLKKGAVARQDTDTQESAYKTSAALVDAQQANIRAAQENVRQAQASLDRMVTLQDYKHVKAPVTGVVTARNIDTGYLISTTGAGQGITPLDMPGAPNPAGGNEMFRVAQIGTLRILVSVPQASAPGIRAGMPARVVVNEFPGRNFAGKVTRTAGSLDPNSRTLLTQIDVPNEDRKLLPGMYATVYLQIHRDAPPLLVPGDSLIAGPGGMQVGILLEVPEKQGVGK